MKSFWLLSAGIAALATPAYAQDQGSTQDQADQAATQNDTGEGQAIIVTAQGRRQILQDVPIAVSAINADALQNSGANDIRQLNQLAPSLLVSSTGTEANGSARIRGIGTVGDNPGLESSVAVFIDGVYRSRSGIGLNELGDVERIEVLRGPQGTLFGRNASAGLINIVTRSPEFQFGGNAELSYGNYDYVRAAGGLTGPISEQLAFRIDGVYVRRDGFYRVVDPVGSTEHRVNDRDRFFTRGQLLWEPSDSLRIRLIGDYTRRNESCCGAVYVGLDETFDPTPGVAGDFATRDSNRIVGIMEDLGGIFPSAGDPFNRQLSVSPNRSYRGLTTDWGFSGQIDWDLGGANLTSITAYRRYKSESPGDYDYSNVDILYRPDDGNSFRRFSTFSQEIRLQGNAFGFLDWLVGGYYANESLHLRDNLTFGSQYGAFASCRLLSAVARPPAFGGPAPGNDDPALRDPSAAGCLSPLGAGFITAAFPTLNATGTDAAAIIAGLNRLSQVNEVGDDDADYYQRSRNWALFTHNIFNITDQLSLTLGVRYTHETKDFSAAFNNNNTFCPAQRAQLLPALATSTNPSAQALLGGLLVLACQGNSSAELNGLTLDDRISEGEFTGTGVLSWRPSSSLLLYASFSHGYKAGGFNLDRSALGGQIGPFPGAASVANLVFDPEKVDSYEVGFKLTHRSVTLNVAAFREVFSSFQLNTFNGSVFLVQNINSCGTDLGGADQDQSGATGTCAPGDVRGGVVSTGIEAEAAIYPARNLAATAGITYADTHYRNNLVGRDTGVPLDPALFLLPGDNLSNAPKWTVTGSLSWTPDIPGTNLSALFYVDGRLTSDYNTGSDLFPEKEQDSYALFNARIGIRGPGQRWAIELWAQNLFNTNYQQVAFNAPFQGSNSRAQIVDFGTPTANQLFASYLAEPRTFGITGRFRF
jgi:outer membrane receptor protein involved in Fe transport